MNSLRIELGISSPILQPQYPIHLDALLYAAFKSASDFSDEEILLELDKILAKENGIYKASAMRFIKSTSMPLVASDVSFVTRTHWTEWEYSKHEREKSVITKGGPFRKRVTEYQAINVGAVEFHAIGDEEKIKYLLEILGFIGLGNNQGFGEISSINFEESEDYCFFDENGELARNLPIEMVSNEIANQCINTVNSVKPPYKTSERKQSVIPNFRVKSI